MGGQQELVPGHVDLTPRSTQPGKLIRSPGRAVDLEAPAEARRSLPRGRPIRSNTSAQPSSPPSTRPAPRNPSALRLRLGRNGSPRLADISTSAVVVSTSPARLRAEAGRLFSAAPRNPPRPARPPPRRCRTPISKGGSRFAPTSSSQTATSSTAARTPASGTRHRQRLIGAKLDHAPPRASTASRASPANVRANRAASTSPAPAWTACSRERLRSGSTLHDSGFIGSTGRTRSRSSGHRSWIRAPAAARVSREQVRDAVVGAPGSDRRSRAGTVSRGATAEDVPGTARPRDDRGRQSSRDGRTVSTTAADLRDRAASGVRDPGRAEAQAIPPPRPRTPVGLQHSPLCGSI